MKVSTAALASNAPNDAAYTTLENKIANWHSLRDTLAGQMKAMLEGAAFSGQSIDEGHASQLIQKAEALLDQVSECAEDIAKCL